jgi:hypothetical protein
MTKIVINKDWGGFSLSDAEMQQYSDLAGLNLIMKPHETAAGWRFTEWKTPDNEDFYDRNILRDDANLVAVVEGLDPATTTLKVVDIPDDVDWVVQEYDGSEWVAEKHRTWY